MPESTICSQSLEMYATVPESSAQRTGRLILLSSCLSSPSPFPKFPLAGSETGYLRMQFTGLS